VQACRPTDRRNWESRGVVLSRPEKGWGELGATEHFHVLYNGATKKNVMWYRWYLHMPAYFLMVSIAHNPEGPFTILRPREMPSSNGFASDMGGFQDDEV